MSALTETLEQQVAARLRERGLVVWLDREGLYSNFVDSLAQSHGDGKFFAPVVGFRGSFLDALLALEPYQDGLDPERLLLHVPGHTDASIRSTPLLEAYKAGVRYERTLDTLVREVAAGRVAPADTESFLLQPDLSLSKAEQWLADRESGPVEGLTGYLHNLKPEWVLESLIDPESELKKRIGSAQDLADLRSYLARHTGLSPEFEHFFLTEESATNLTTLAEVFIAWLLCVEYVHDLSRPVSLADLSVLHELSAPLKKTTIKLVQKLRQIAPDIYREQAMQLENLLSSELEAGSPEDLGKIDTFSREDSRLLEAAVTSLKKEQWQAALRWSTERLGSPSVWVQNDITRRQEWTLVKTAARLGQSLVTSPRPLEKADNLSTAIERYTGSGKDSRDDGAQAVDRAHREFEQERLRLLNAQLPHFAILHDALGQLRRRYRAWVDQLSEDFSRVCTQDGFLPTPDLQQRTLYEQVVHPLTKRDGHPVAFFLVDALRYEMASELANSLGDQASVLQLKPRLAELPTVTSVGMNVLAPVSRDGKLTLEKPFKGFRAGEYVVANAQSRLRAMGERSLERHSGERRTPVSFKLQELGNTAPAALKKKVKESALVVVHSREIDGAGEADVGLLGLDQWLGLLRSAVLNLRAAGVEEFVITADHGFMLLDETSEAVTYNTGTVDRRYILTDAPINEEKMATVTLESLGYVGHQGHLMFLRDSRVFATKGVSAQSFAHGGNSLQERVIPVLRVSYRRKGKLNLNRYRIEAEALSAVMGCSRLKVTLKKTSAEQGVLDFAVGEKVTIALRLADLSGQVVIKDASEAEMHNQQLLLEENKATEVYFTISALGEGKAAVELYHPDGVKDVEPCRPVAFFPIDVNLGLPNSEPLIPPVTWEQNLPEHVRGIFAHIELFDSITEEEVIAKLGGARQARRFATKLEEYVTCLPFNVMVESAASGKRWVRG